VQRLVTAGANVNLKGSSLRTALTEAVVGGDIRVLDYVIDAGADVNETGWSHGDPMMTAIGTVSKIGNIEAVKRLLQAGADLICVIGYYGSLQIAASEGNTDLIDLLS
jgi:ankyrin repeat protein